MGNTLNKSFIRTKSLPRSRPQEALPPKLEEVVETHIEQVEHQKEVIVKIGASKGPPPFRRAIVWELLQIVPGKSCPA